jgi:hypothetical protein
MAVLPKLFLGIASLLGVIHVITAQFKGMKVECKPKDVTRLVSHPGCIPKEVVVSACQGTCRSLSAILMKEPWFETICECCKRTSTTKKQVTLTCQGGQSHSEYVLSANGCKCQQCSH